MKTERRTHIEQRAEKALRDSGAYRIPVPVDLVANHLSLTIEASLLHEKVSGLLVVENKRGAICYNSTHVAVRQRFTVAHEIGHYLLHIPKSMQSRLFIDRYVAYRRDDEDGDTNDHEEVEANAFAAALLMPSSLVREDIKRQDLDLDDEDDLCTLAKRFNVSGSSMSFRLAKIGLLR